ncbi:discoidin domain-containing protein [Streptomyces spinosirectus]|uniref:discoidin domain-containing protein n=1 Tax=Streptomyces TaxID=1883 RepID=UPI001C9D7D44|nr:MULTISPECIES: discoidin domain-containing protein [Streptomyces]MBY8339594.1 discoidin domain-containing protein [Streptomyces plumbidurans]UIR15671.1 discoidin domain-containing protein [Streptomyces spinosirectus]
MSHGSPQINRRRFVQLLSASAALATLPAAVGANSARADGRSSVAPDAVAETYYRVLLNHTHWSETQWDAARGYYTDKDFGFAVVLGNAVLLTRGSYDSDRAGIDEQTLKTRTLATIKHFAASNRLTGGTQWGRTLFFDTTFQLYFVLAARLLWDDLDETTRNNVDTITREQAAYTTSLGTGNDPNSGSWTPNGLLGGHVGDTKLEEMGVYAQSLAPGLAWAANDPRHADWAKAFGAWSRNETGLPQADLANPTRVDGVPVSANTARNLYDTFIVENHGSFGPHYQEELWRTSGRNSIHFITAGRPLPQVLTHQPNADPLWRTLLGVMSDAGEPLMPMVNDREHLYGRDVIPLAFLAQVGKDRAAARAEVALAERLEAYQKYPPEYRLAKFSGEPKYEPEARAELAISYLLHLWAAEQGHTVRPLSQDELFEQAAGVTDFGTGPGLVSHQSTAAWAGAVTKPGFVKFAWQPAHDDWLFKLSGATPMFLPTSTAQVTTRQVRTYSRLRDGFDGSATMLHLNTGYAGLTTLPSGAVVYATTGTAAGEGHLEVHNLTMPGMAGLTGSRTYRFEEGSTSVAAQDTGTTAATPRVDEVTFARTEVRHLRMLGVRPDPTYGYSLYAFEARDGASGSDLAQGGTATASSFDPGKEPALAVDGNATSRWAVSRADRPRADSWLAVDLDDVHAVDRVTLRWEAAAGRAYTVQGSTDGEQWTDLASWPAPDVSSKGGWLDVDGRAGLIVRGSKLPLAVYGDTVVLADGPAAPLLVEGLPGTSADSLRQLARRAQPQAQDDAVRVALTEGHLSLFNLSERQVTTRVDIPQSGSQRVVFEGRQTLTTSGSSYEAELDAGTATLLPPRLTLRALSGGRLPAGLRAEVTDAATVRLTGPSCRVRVGGQGHSEVAVVRAGRTTTVTLHQATAYPVDDLALGRTVFPTNPLPPGMTAPSAAVDGDPNTAWTPGPDGRMVVDLGSQLSVRTIRTAWTTGQIPALRAEFSSDGLTYTPAGQLTGHGRTRQLTTDATTRYVALTTDARGSNGARLISLSLN